MPGLYCPSSWTPLPLTDSCVRAYAKGPCLSLRARLTYHNPQPQPVDGEAWCGRGGNKFQVGFDLASARSCSQVCSCTRWLRPRWYLALRPRRLDGESPSSCRAGVARRLPAAALWARDWGPLRPVAVHRVSKLPASALKCQPQLEFLHRRASRQPSFFF